MHFRIARLAQTVRCIHQSRTMAEGALEDFKATRARSVLVEDFPFSKTYTLPPKSSSNAATGQESLSTSTQAAESASSSSSSTWKPSQPHLPNRRSTVMKYVQRDLITKESPFTPLFAKNSPDRLEGGSVISITSYTSGLRQATSTFSGVLIAVNRHGVSTSFNVRNVIMGTGVEVQYMLESPMIQKIAIIKRARRVGKNYTGPDIRAPSRAKMYYVRDHPEKLAGVQKILKEEVERQKVEKEAAKAAKRSSSRQQQQKK